MKSTPVLSISARASATSGAIFGSGSAHALHIHSGEEPGIDTETGAAEDTDLTQIRVGPDVAWDKDLRLRPGQGQFKTEAEDAFTQAQHTGGLQVELPRQPLAR